MPPPPAEPFAARVLLGPALRAQPDRRLVTQDAFSKALLALRGTTTEIELKPWLYRIVRNTALNEIRDAPPPTEELGETTPGAHSAAVEVERREEIGELMERLRALPEPQRAATPSSSTRSSSTTSYLAVSQSGPTPTSTSSGGSSW